jgi:hypothetical protein
VEARNTHLRSEGGGHCTGLDRVARFAGRERRCSSLSEGRGRRVRVVERRFAMRLVMSLRTLAVRRREDCIFVPF